MRDRSSITTSGTPLARETLGRVVGFTGSRQEPTPEQWARHLYPHLGQLGYASGFVTGGCVGIDHIVGRWLFHHYPERHHTVVVPADRSRVAAWWRHYLPGGAGPVATNLTVIEMPPGTDYRSRNVRLVGLCEILIGYPQYGEGHPRSQRSGSWQTLRLARQQHLTRPLAYALEDM